MKKLLFLALFLPSLSFAEVRINHPPLQVNDNGNISYGYFYLLTITGGTFTNNNDGTIAVNCGAITTPFLLLEDASFLLFEDGGKIIIE